MLLKHPTVLQKARALGVDLNPKPQGNTEDVPTYERPPSAQQGGQQPMQGYPPAPSPSGGYGVPQQQAQQQNAQYNGPGGHPFAAAGPPPAGGVYAHARQQQHGIPPPQHPFDLPAAGQRAPAAQGRAQGSPAQPGAHPFIDPNVGAMAGEFQRMQVRGGVGVTSATCACAHSACIHSEP